SNTKIMATKGQIISNKITGETLQWAATAKDTGGKYLELSMAVLPKGLAAANHVHPNQDELFTIRKGTLKIQINNEVRLVFPGQSITVPKGTPHQWWNPSETENLSMDIRFTPALATEDFFEQFFGLCNDDKNKPDGMFRFWQMMASVNHFDIYDSR